MSEYWSIERHWEGQTVAILGGGPSMEALDIEALHVSGCRAIAINDAFRLALWADLLYFCDRKWWDGAEGRRRDVLISFPGSIATLETEFLGVRRLRNTGETGWDPAPDAIRTGRNSGYQALQVVAKLGARRIVLFGYDFRVQGEKTHWGERPERQQPADFARTLAVDMLPLFDGLIEPLCNIEIFNASPGSRLQLWPVVSHAEGLALLQT